MKAGVVLADDHALFRGGVEQLLAGSPFELVASVGTGAEALAKIARLDPAIAILDIRMPEGTGIEVIEALRARGDRRPVVLLSADLEDRDLLAAIDLGVEGILLKTGAERILLDCLAAVYDGGKWIDPEIQAMVEGARSRIHGDPRRHLNSRELEMAGMVADGLRNQNIADRLGTTEGAVKFALHRVFRKLEVTSRLELTLLWRRYAQPD